MALKLGATHVVYHEHLPQQPHFLILHERLSRTAQHKFSFDHNPRKIHSSVSEKTYLTNIVFPVLDNDLMQGIEIKRIIRVTAALVRECLPPALLTYLLPPSRRSPAHDGGC